MMPPKKSKAARAEQEEKQSIAEEKEPIAEATANGHTEEESVEKPVVNHKNVFQATIVEGKRKRTIPPTEAKLADWFAQHLEVKGDVHYKAGDLHAAFVNECIAEGIPGVEDIFFRKRLQDAFPKGYAIKEDSAYSKEIKQRKKINRPKTQGDTFKLKPKEVLERAFKDLGNPVNGVRFNTIRQYIAAKYPALRVDQRPQYVISALKNGVNWGYVELLRGIKKSGVYRLYVEGRDIDAEMEKEKEKKEKKKEKKTGKDGEEVSEEKKEESSEDNKAGGDTETEEDKEKEGEEKKEDGGGEEKKKKKKAAKPVAPKSRQYAIRHSAPERIEDCFPLALAFGTEPKRCSVQKISTYISRHYPDVAVDQRLKQCLERGCEKGFWEHISGQTYELTVENFDPTDDDDLLGKVVNAIMACTEPKQCSATIIKKYVLEFHPEFKVAELPHKFKKALDRAEKCGDLIRLSGIGGSGSFQLSYVFSPSPVVLQAQDTESDYEGSDDDDVAGPAGLTGAEAKNADIKAYQDAYVPRPSQRRGKARQAAGHSAFQRQAEFAAEMAKKQMTKSPQATHKRKATTKKATSKRGRGGASAATSTDSEDSEEEDLDDMYSPKGKAGKKAKKRQAEEEVEAYKPRPSASRGGRARSPPPPPKPKSAAKKKAVVTKAAKKAPPPPSPKGKGRRKPSPAQKKSAGKRRTKKESVEEEEEEEEEVAKAKESPQKKSTGRRTPKKEAPKYNMESGEEEEEEEEVAEVKESPQKKSTGRGTPKKVAPKYNMESGPEDEEEEEEAQAEESDNEPSPPPKKKAKATPAKGRSAKKGRAASPSPSTLKRTPRSATKAKYTPDSDSEEEVMPTKKARGRNR